MKTVYSKEVQYNTGLKRVENIFNKLKLLGFSTYEATEWTKFYCCKSYNFTKNKSLFRF